MKKADGTYEDWAEDPIFRQDFLKHVLIAYYVLFGKYFIYLFQYMAFNCRLFNICITF